LRRGTVLEQFGTTGGDKTKGMNDGFSAATIRAKFPGGES
jgi:hypothetical protein